MQQLGLAAGGELAQQVGGVIGLHLVQHARQALQVKALDQAHLLVLGELLQQVGEAVVLQLGGQDAPAAERQPPDRAGHLGRMQAAQLRRLAVDGAVRREQLAGL